MNFFVDRCLPPSTSLQFRYNSTAGSCRNRTKGSDMPGRRWVDLTQYAVRARADLSASVTHWTREYGSDDVFTVLRKIILEKCIKASTSKGGFIKANQKAACFTEIPVSVMSRLFRQADHDSEIKRFLIWRSYGLSFLKTVLYKQLGGRPVLYLSDHEFNAWIKHVGPAKKSSRFEWSGSTTAIPNRSSTFHMKESGALPMTLISVNFWEWLGRSRL